MERFPDEIERVRYSFHDDWTGEPSLYLRVLLKHGFDKEEFVRDAQIRRDFLEKCQRIEASIEDVLKDCTQIYYLFRSVAEQEQIQDPDWA